MNKKDQFDFITYGAKVDSERVTELVNHIMQVQHGSNNTTPLCIWGTHGIGKTQLIEKIATDSGLQFVYIAPAQFEEMGDLIGMPHISQTESGEVSQFAPPEWVPKEEGPGILLIDDVNRADDRILRGIMQLLQNYELISWKLPRKWMIVLTANPDGGDYSVTTMDDAMITRMIHVTMEFNVKSWARWAEQAGIDARGIEFVLTYPEIVTGNRTTPRTLVQFFESIQPISNLYENLDLVKMLADGCLDEETAVAFINFVRMDLDKIISPEEILSSGQFKIIAGQINELIGQQPKRLDILSVMMTRLTNHLLFNKESLDNKEFDNLKSFILLDIIPNDLRLSMAQELVNSSKTHLKKMYAIPEIGKLILTKM
ncbi:AAA family ATPase [Fulvivirga maritima]|uniref:ATP-binding protein n=1 Tax=Fulvivirga maritima TaxID=2904247 RepID=UPI001F3F74F9|nr:AAA family ATPase [Fulvivirga maritima]UII25880.1 AAA family ATPase [Fulvivirga maritima]